MIRRFRECEIIGNHRGSQPYPETAYSTGVLRLYEDGSLVGIIKDYTYDVPSAAGVNHVAIGLHERDNFMRFWKFPNLQENASQYLLSNTTEETYLGSRTQTSATLESLAAEFFEQEINEISIALRAQDERVALDRLMGLTLRFSEYLMSLTHTKIGQVLASQKAMVQIVKK